MNFVVTGEGRHIDLGSKSKTWDQLISIVVKYDGTNFMKGLLVLTPFVSSMVMKRSVGSLNTVTGSEINADNHCHLQSCGEEISEVILDSLFEVLKNDDSFLLASFSESHPVLALHESAKIEITFSNN